VIVRGYRDADLDACRALWVELTQWHRDIYGAPEIGGSDPASHFNSHLERVGPENIWIAEIDDDVVGFAGLILEGKTAELEPIVVSGACRGQGIGRALANAVVSRARKRGLRRLVVRPAARNAEAIGFFHSRGFGVLGQVELMLELVPMDGWRPGERLAGRDFLV
jgi:N-acetylglutamate synthase-like GNAT family acetyltransferase